MSPEDLATVERSWSELCTCRAALTDGLTDEFRSAGETAIDPPTRAAWLIDAVAALVGLLTAPSKLAEHARHLATTWPDETSSPTFRVEGQAWMGAAARVSDHWSDRVERAWLHAWLLLSEVLAAEALSPFADVSPTVPGPGAAR